MTDTTDAHDSVADDGQKRRRFLTAATSAVGVAGVAGVAVPFLGSWNPSEKAKAAGAPVRADISKLEPGQMVVIEWRGKPVYVLRRTPDQVAGLATLNDDLKDPSSEASAQPGYIEGDGRLPNSGLRSARQTWVATSGWAASFALATAPNLIWPGAYTKAYRRLPILKFPPIPMRATAYY